MAIENKRLSLVLDMVDKITAPAQKVGETLKATGKAVEATRVKVSSLQTQASDISSLSALRGEMEKAGKKSRDLAAKAVELKTKLEATEKPTTAMKKELREIEKASRDAEKAFRAQEAKVGQLSDKLRRSGVDTRNLSQAMRDNRIQSAQESAELKRQAEALDKLTKAQLRATEAKEKHEKAMAASQKAMAVGGGMMAGGAAVMAASYAAGSPFRSFDAQMSAVQATGGMDDATKERLSKLARDEAKVSAWGALDAANAQEYLAMAGFDEKAITASLRGVMNLASATKTGLAETADISTNILSGFGLDASEMARVSDVLTKVTSTANTNLTELGGAMKYVAPVAKTAGYDIESVAAAAGLMANVGIKDSQAGTALRASILRMASLPKAARDAFAEVKVQTTDAKGNLRGLEYVLADVAKATEKMGSGERLQKLSAMFGVEAAAGLAELLDKSSGDEMMAYIQKLEQAAGATDKAAATRLKNLDGDLQMLFSGIEEVRIKYGESLDKMYRGIIRFSTEIVAKIDEWMAKNPKLVKAIGLVATAFGALMVVSGALIVALGALWLVMAKGRLAMFLLRWAAMDVVKAFAGAVWGAMKFTAALLKNIAVMTAQVAWFVISKAAMAAYAAGSLALRGVIVAATAAQWLLNAALSANPIGLVIMGIAALIAAGALLYKNWDKVAAFFGQMWATIKGVFSEGVSYIMGLLSMSPAAALSKFASDAMGAFGALWDGIKGLFGAGMAGIRQILSMTPAEAVSALLGFFGGMWESIAGIWDAGLAKLAGFDAVGLMREAWEPVADFFDGLWGGIWSGMMDKIDAMTNKVKDFGKWALDGFGMFDDEQAGKEPERQGAAPVAAPKVVQGGVVRPPAQKAQIIDQRKTEIVIHAAPGMDVNELGRVVDRKLDERDRKQAQMNRARYGD